MRSTNRSVDIGGTGVDLPPATSLPYFTRTDIERLAHVGDGLSLTNLISLGVYRGELRRAIHAMKFRNRRWISARLGVLLGRRLSTLQGDWRADVVTWVPTTAARMRLRGHDQAAVVAGGVARTLRIARRRALRRVGSHTQTGQTEAQRRVGPQYVAHPRVVRGRRVLLVDDVMTTGTSLHRATAALRAAGAREVRCAVVAHVPLRHARQSPSRPKVG